MNNELDNLQIAKEVAIQLLNVPIAFAEYGIIHHPFFNANIFSDGKNLFTIDTKEGFQKACDYMKLNIMLCKNIASIFWLINKPYMMLYFKLINTLLKEPEYSELLMYCYQATEFPNDDKNVSIHEITSFFKKANPQNLMSEKEYKFWVNLDPILTVYRGQDVKTKPKNRLSWTLDHEQAKWFATRFSSVGYVFTGKVKKEDIFCYTNYENEIIAQNVRVQHTETVDRN